MKRVAAVAFALLLILLPSPARADDPPAGPCVEAVLTGLSFDPDTRAMVLNGSATQCAPTEMFWVSTYIDRAPWGNSHAHQKRYFNTEVGEPQPFAIRVMGPGSTYRVCVQTTGGDPLEGKRVVCATVASSSPPTGPPSGTVAPLGTEDPLVDKWVLHIGAPTGPDGDPDGLCGTCF